MINTQMYKDKRFGVEINKSIRWLFGLGLFGLLVSFYLVYEHYSVKPGESSTCDINETVSCSTVLGSKYAQIFGIPLAFLGITYNLTLLILIFLVARNEEKLESMVWNLSLFLWSGFGLIFVAYLLFAEYILGAICPLCTVIHVVIIAVFYHSYRIYKEQRHNPTFGNFVAVVYPYVIVLGILHLGMLLFFNIHSDPPPPQNKVVELAKCLTEEGFAMYGSESCSHCMKQKKMFGDAFEHIIFHECEKSYELCEKKQIEGYPTWIQDGPNSKEIQRIVGAQSLKTLASYTKSCNIDLNPEEDH